MANLHQARRILDDVCSELPEKWAQVIREYQNELEISHANTSTNTEETSKRCETRNEREMLKLLPKPTRKVTTSYLKDNGNLQKRTSVRNKVLFLSKNLISLEKEYEALSDQSTSRIEQIAFVITKYDQHIREYLRLSETLCPGTGQLISHAWQMMLKLLRHLMIKHQSAKERLTTKLTDINLQLQNLKAQVDSESCALQQLKKSVQRLEMDLHLEDTVARKKTIELQHEIQSVNLLAREIENEIFEIPMVRSHRKGHSSESLCEAVSVTEALLTSKTKIQQVVRHGTEDLTGEVIHLVGEETIAKPDEFEIYSFVWEEEDSTSSENEGEADAQDTSESNTVLRVEPVEASSESVTRSSSVIDRENKCDDIKPMISTVGQTRETNSVVKRRHAQVIATKQPFGADTTETIDQEYIYKSVRNNKVIDLKESTMVRQLVQKCALLRTKTEKQVSWKWNLGTKHKAIQKERGMKCNVNTAACNTTAVEVQHKVDTASSLTARRRNRKSTVCSDKVIHARVSKLQFQLPERIVKLFSTMPEIRDANWLTEWAESNAKSGGTLSLLETHRMMNKILFTGMLEMGNVCMYEFVYDFFVANEETIAVAEVVLLRFLCSVHRHSNSSAQVHLFAQLNGTAQPALKGNEVELFMNLLRKFANKNEQHESIFEGEDGSLWVPLQNAIEVVDKMLGQPSSESGSTMLMKGAAVSSTRQEKISKYAKGKQHIEIVHVADIIRIVLNEYERSIERAQQRCEELFAKADTNGDGMLSFEEFSALLKTIDSTISIHQIARMFREAGMQQRDYLPEDSQSVGNTQSRNDGEEIALDEESFAKLVAAHNLLSKVYPTS